jgi:hypothetical protein
LQTQLRRYRAFLAQNESNLTRQVIDDVVTSLRQVPVDIRFFQDGIMILHLLSDFGSRTIVVPTLGRGS